ncbi:MAG: hypothetical protein D6735_02245, partial [Acidobacteria bacterium]
MSYSLTSDDNLPIYRPFRAAIARSPRQGWVYFARGIWPDLPEGTLLADNILLAFGSNPSHALLLRTEDEIQKVKALANQSSIEDLTIEEAGPNIIACLVPFDGSLDSVFTQPLFFHFVYNNDVPGNLNAHQDLLTKPFARLYSTKDHLWIFTDKVSTAMRLDH